ncbi:TraK family protein [Limobrevibacterium gyesilva]|uniref:TraK family protein n=1 Tax=Limobrevibacterium gyesilva TaxID=2991712 RepID=A0AA41YTF8_9PROT|nr:TraK family protein [Limobrevibacterium gyesilva]MCW3476243.1 TraK family protein [Limobrevibacterium gyesilva]
MPDRQLPVSAAAPGAQSNKPAPKEWGVGRVAFFARIDAIRAELAQGWPLTAIYARHRESLGISYSGFCKLVSRHAADARPSRRQAPEASSGISPSTSVLTSGGGGNTSIAALPPHGAPAAPSPPSILEEGSAPHARQQPARTFVHDPVERPGDYERLFGARRR